MSKETSLSGVLLPMQPILARDGRPFDIGTKATSLPWLYPSVTAGCLRSLAGRQGNAEPVIEQLQELAVRGPFPWWDNNLYFPAPADAQRHADAESLRAAQGRTPSFKYRRLALPSESDANHGFFVRLARFIQRNDTAETPADDVHTNTQLAVPVIKHPEKAPPGLAWWSESDFRRWLSPDSADKPFVVDNPPAFAHGFARVTRTHARIDVNTGTTSDGDLFQTTGLDFSSTDDRRLDPVGIALAISGPDASVIEPLRASVMTTLGGERRAAWWEPANAVDAAMRRMREAGSTLTKLRGKKRGLLRAVLVTPAYFEKGWWPDFIDPESATGTYNNARLKLVGAALRRWVGVSGWDMDKKQPKIMRRLVPAGSVFYFRSEDAFVFENAMLASLCTDPSSRHDGFGLALWGLDR